jgi:flavin reductase (DIM6/NTAB) family NADH-FMN oxidoreductase RutF
VNEFERAGLTPIPSREIRPPRVAESPVHLECVLDRVIELGEGATDLVLGRAVRIHYAMEVCRDGACDIHLLGAIGRLGGQLYGIVDHVVEIPPPPPDH